MKKKTIQKSVSFSGIGLHSGRMIGIKLLPRKSGGIVFKNDKGDTLKALFSNVIDTQLGTTISNGKITAGTIEHLMAAIFACNIDSLTIKISGEEMPILDGSAELFIKQLKKVGIVNLKDDRKYLKILKPVACAEGDKFVKIFPDENFSIDMSVNFPYGGIGEQCLLWNGQEETFSARTFCHLKEIEFLWSKGLSQGGTLENAMVFDDNCLLNIKDVKFKMNSEGAEKKMLDIIEDYIKKHGKVYYHFRMKDEVVNHKVLDCIGDMFTVGYYIKGKIIANKTGHSLNNQLLKKIFEDKNNYAVE
jgi:UDP-3-O-[3-hydroxymyristoyl] N-acetylglucosamine deacetylase